MAWLTRTFLILTFLVGPPLVSATTTHSIDEPITEDNPLVLAIDQDDSLALQAWLQQGNDPMIRIKNKVKERLIDRAAAQASEKCFIVLLNAIHNAHQDAKLNDSRGTPLIVTLASLVIPGKSKTSAYEAMIDLLLKLNPKSAQEKDRAYVGDGRIALHEVAALGNIKVMQKLIAQGAPINAKSSNGETPLHLAARFGRLDAVKYLVQSGALVNERSRFTQTTPLMAAAEMGQESVIRFLMISGAKRDLKDAFGKTAPERFKEYTSLYNSSTQKKR